jgi:hypothetical protein
MGDAEDDHPMPDPTAAQQAAKQGRAAQMAVYDAYMKGERVDFKNHQNNLHSEKYDPAVFKKPKSTKLKFTDKYKFFDAVERNEVDEGITLPSRAEPP